MNVQIKTLKTSMEFANASSGIKTLVQKLESNSLSSAFKLPFAISTRLILAETQLTVKWTVLPIPLPIFSDNASATTISNRTQPSSRQFPANAIVQKLSDKSQLYPLLNVPNNVQPTLN